MNDIEIIKSYSESAYEFIKSNKIQSCEKGKYELENGAYVNIESYVTELRVNRKFEAHKDYIDIQYMIDGEELITISSTDVLSICEPYDEKKDIEFYNNDLNGEDMLITSNSFLIIKPGQAHMPCICVNGKQSVKKAVFKIPVVSIK